VRFFEEASQHGDLYVSIGSDKTVFELKNRPTLYNEQERLYMVSSLKFVHWAFVASGSGKLDFENEIRQIKPDIFFVNEDGHSDEKQKFIESLGIRYVVSKRQAKENLPIRSTTSIRQSINR
jgi:glycerol-3-phosphate cytidylyltransferase-like family protein